jgi:hypothetical protein
MAAAGLVIGYANPPEHADQPLTYDDVELDDGSTILQVRRLLDLLLWNGPPTSRPSVPGPCSPTDPDGAAHAHGFTVTCEACNAFRAAGRRLPDSMLEEVAAHRGWKVG